MQERARFVEEWLDGDHNGISELCRAFGISRKLVTSGSHASNKMEYPHLQIAAEPYINGAWVVRAKPNSLPMIPNLAAGLSLEQIAQLVVGLQPSPQTSRPKATAKKTSSNAKNRGASRRSKGGNKSKAQGPTHNTRTKEGRASLDQAILDFLKTQKEPVRALDIRQAIGGTSAQVRTRLNALIEKNKVLYKGRASGTRYRARG